MKFESKVNLQLKMLAVTISLLAIWCSWHELSKII